MAAMPLRAQEAGSPESFYDGILRDPWLKKQGEDFCWHAAYDLHGFVRAYQAWGDTAWLDQGVRYYEYLVAQLATGPDGYQGWIGPYEYDNSVWCDVHVGDAVLFNGMVEFAELVLADRKLRDRYGAQGRKYVDLRGGISSTNGTRGGRGKRMVRTAHTGRGTSTAIRES